MEMLTAANIMAIPFPLRRGSINEKILLPVYYPFIEGISKQCHLPANDHRLRTTDWGFTYNKSWFVVISVMVLISQGTTWAEFDEEMRDAANEHMDHPGPMSSEFYRNYKDIDEQRETIVRYAPRLGEFGERAREAIQESSLRLIDLQANLRLATWEFNEEDIHAFLSCVPLTVRDGVIERVSA